MITAPAFVWAFMISVSKHRVPTAEDGATNTDILYSCIQLSDYKAYTQAKKDWLKEKEKEMEE